MARNGLTNSGIQVDLGPVRVAPETQRAAAIGLAGIAIEQGVPAAELRDALEALGLTPTREVVAP